MTDSSPHVGPEGRRLATDADGEAYWSAEGCTQGDALGPFFFAVGYHTSLLRVQAVHPDAGVVCYLDDTYYLQEPVEALAALRTGEEVSVASCSVRSNRGKQEVYGGEHADLTAMPATLRGSPWAPPDEDKGYAGGRLSSTKVLGAYVGDSSVCATQLCARVAEALAPLEHAVRVRDTRAINVSLHPSSALLVRWLRLSLQQRSHRARSPVCRSSRRYGLLTAAGEISLGCCSEGQCAKVATANPLAPGLIVAAWGLLAYARSGTPCTIDYRSHSKSVQGTGRSPLTY